jgi:cytochrome c
MERNVMRIAGRRLAFATWAVLLATTVAHAEADATRGQKKYEECAACHSLDRAATDSVGPTLYGVFTRKAGELPDFRFSPAMKRSGIQWTPQTLDTFLTDPQATVPANRMPYAGMTDAAARADLIAYLQQTFK